MRALLNAFLVAGIDLVRHDQVLDMAKDLDLAKDGSELVRNHQAEVTAHGVDTAAAADLALSENPVDTAACPPLNGPVYAKGEGGMHLRLGFQEQDVRCESCSSGWSSTDEPPAYKNYDLYWNAAVGTRAFWTSRADNGRDVGALERCPDPFVRQFKVDVPGFIPKVINHVTGDRICALPNDIRFLGESCTHRSQCTHLSPWLDLTCAPSAKDAEGKPSELKCMYVEDADGAYGSYDDNTCKCTGFSSMSFSCTNDDQCHGNQCYTSTYDGKLHCRATSDKKQCSNCRANKADSYRGRGPCQHPDGKDIWTVHTSEEMIKQDQLPLKKIKSD